MLFIRNEMKNDPSNQIHKNKVELRYFVGGRYI